MKDTCKKLVKLFLSGTVHDCIRRSTAMTQMQQKDERGKIILQLSCMLPREQKLDPA